MSRVAAAIAPAAAAPAASSGLLLQRKCACAQHEGPSQCEECGKDKLQRKAAGGFNPRYAPAIVNKVLRAPGQPLGGAARAFMEDRFAHSFGNVRIHTDAEAARSARAVGAAAYTVGRNVVFDHGRYAPDTASGRRLLAHELTHVVQQRGATAGGAGGLRIDSSHSAGEVEADRISAAIESGHSQAGAAQPRRAGLHQPAEIVSRRDAGAPDAVPLVMNLGKTPHTGLQFWPTDVRDTVVGPVTIQGGLLNGGASRLNVIIGENMTLHTLALELLPLWTTATPFTPAGAATPLPLDLVTADQLARALLVYNQTYLEVPPTLPATMNKWHAGLRLPLPVEIDEATHVATLNPQQIIAMAGTFDAAWAPLLEQRATSPAAHSAALIMLEVANFLHEHTDATDRGITLGARALTNATVELPFVREVFRQLSTAESIATATAFLDNFTNREFQLLAAQRDGNAILTLFETPLNTARLTPDQDSRLFGMSIAILNTTAAAPPDAARSRSEKTVGIDMLKLDGSNHNPAADLDVTNGIFAQCNVRFVPGVNQAANPTDTVTWLGADRIVRRSPTCGNTSAEERRLVRDAATQFRMTSRIRAFFVVGTHDRQRAYSVPPFCGTGAAAVQRNAAYISNLGNSRTLAHEIGHILLNSGAHPGKTQVMSPADPHPPQGETFTDAECTKIYNNA